MSSIQADKIKYQHHMGIQKKKKKMGRGASWSRGVVFERTVYISD